MDIFSSIQPLLFMSMTNTTQHPSNILFTFLIIVMPYISKVIPFEIFYDKLREYFKRNTNYVSVYISSHEIPILRSSSSMLATKLVYSKTFLSIIHYITQHKKIKFESLTEIMTNNSELSDNFWDSSKRATDSFLMMPVDNERVLVSEKHGIYFELKEIKVSDEPDTSTSSSSSSSSRLPTNKKNFTIVLSESKKDSAGLDHIHAFMEECIKDYDAVLNRKLKDNRQYLFEFKGSDNEDGQLTLKYSEHLMEHNKDLNTNIFFEAKQRLIQYIQPFVYDETNVEGVNEGEKQYNKTGFTFKAGLLFYGSPGCGKTSTIKAILKYTKRHGIIINLSKVKTCEELEYLFRNREINKRKLVGKQLCFILEDCDASEDSIVQSRELIQAKHRLDEFLKEELNPVSQVIEITKQEMASNLIKPIDKINLSCFLNVLDGIIELHGVMIIMTTNYPDKIDAALIRPGRFDFKHEFKKATKQIIIDMLTFRYGLTDETTIKSLSSRLKVGNEVLSPAEIQSICFKNENIFDAIKEINEIKH